MDKHRIERIFSAIDNLNKKELEYFLIAFKGKMETSKEKQNSIKNDQSLDEEKDVWDVNEPF